MLPIITVTDLQKYFKIRQHHRGFLGSFRNFLTFQSNIIRAVDGICFNVKAGELVGYLGPNGAGKSTTIKMLTGLLVPTGGELIVNGRIPWKERKTHVANIGAVFGQRTTLWWDLPVIESLELLKYIYKIPPTLFQKNLEEFQELLGLEAFFNIPVRSLSLGQRMRADLCAALLHDPQILFLDEPTIGLDVVAKERIRQFIRHINREHGTTIILTTHDLSDIEKLCERVLIIDHGKLLYDGALSVLQERFGGKRLLVVDFVDDYPSTKVDLAEIVDKEGTRVTYQFHRKDISASDLINMLSTRYRIHDLEVKDPDIEDTIRRIYEERLLEL